MLSQKDYSPKPWVIKIRKKKKAPSSRAEPSPHDCLGDRTQQQHRKLPVLLVAHEKQITQCLRIPRPLVTGHRETQGELSWKRPACWGVFTVLQGSVATGGGVSATLSLCCGPRVPHCSLGHLCHSLQAPGASV